MKRWKPKLSNTGVFELEAELTVLILEGEGAEPRMLLLFLYYFYIIFIIFILFLFFAKDDWNQTRKILSKSVQNDTEKHERIWPLSLTGLVTIVAHHVIGWSPQAPNSWGYL